MGIYKEFSMATLGYVVCFVLYFESDLSKIKCRAANLDEKNAE